MEERNLEMSLETFKNLRDLIYEKSGIYFVENKKYFLENRLSKRVLDRNLKNFEEYYFFLKYDSRKTQEYPFLYDSVTTNETSFFRNPPQLEAFENFVLKEVMDKARNPGPKKLRILSLPCSTGEEPYTLSMMCLEKKLPAQGWALEIQAGDISPGTLDSARKGIYGKNSVRNTPPYYLNKYFTLSGENYIIKDEVKKFVQFDCVNLVDSRKIKIFGNFDVIFCRNVLIYFDEKIKRKVVSDLYDALKPNGFLFIGHSESLHNISRAFKLVNFSRSPIYKKE